MLLIRVNSVALYSVGPVSYSITMNGSHGLLPPFDSLSAFEPRLGIRLSLGEYWNSIVEAALTCVGGGSVLAAVCVKQFTPLWEGGSRVRHPLGECWTFIVEAALTCVRGGSVRAGVCVKQFTPLWEGGSRVRHLTSDAEWSEASGRVRPGSDGRRLTRLGNLSAVVGREHRKRH